MIHTTLGCMNNVRKESQSKAYSELSQTSKMELFVRIVDNSKLLTIFTKSSTLHFGRVLNMILIYTFQVKKGNALDVFFSVEEASQASHTFSSDKCVICQDDFDKNAPAVIVHQKGLATLIKVSEEQKMTDLNIYLARMNDSGGVVIVYHNCQRKFTDARHKTTKK